MTDEALMIWATVFVLVSLALFVIEVFIPSGGLLGVLSFVSLVAAVVCVYQIDATAGAVATVIAVVAVPLAFVLALKVVPNTFIGKMLTLSSAQDTRMKTRDPVMDGEFEAKVGQIGVAVGELRPVGTCEIDGKRLECLAETGLIDAGTKVSIVSIEGMEIKVRAV